jgi:hypothetical protein
MKQKMISADLFGIMRIVVCVLLSPVSAGTDSALQLASWLIGWLVCYLVGSSIRAPLQGHRIEVEVQNQFRRFECLRTDFALELQAEALRWKRKAIGLKLKCIISSADSNVSELILHLNSKPKPCAGRE